MHSILALNSQLGTWSCPATRMQFDQQVEMIWTSIFLYLYLISFS
jgi:hypothetical protein